MNGDANNVMENISNIFGFLDGAVNDLCRPKVRVNLLSIILFYI